MPGHGWPTERASRCGVMSWATVKPLPCTRLRTVPGSVTFTRLLSDVTFTRLYRCHVGMMWPGRPGAPMAKCRLPVDTDIFLAAVPAEYSVHCLRGTDQIQVQVFIIEKTCHPTSMAFDSMLYVDNIYYVRYYLNIHDFCLFVQVRFAPFFVHCRKVCRKSLPLSVRRVTCVLP